MNIATIIMRKTSILFCVFFVISVSIQAQTFLPVWEKENMPNSKGGVVRDSIVNEIAYKIGTPGMYVFQPSRMANEGAAVLILPGGGYGHIAYQIGGFQFAKWLNSLGVTAFVLTYRLPQSADVDTCYKAPLQDAQRALRYIRGNAEKWGIKANKIGVMGSSAGGHLSACLSTFKEDWSGVDDSLDSVSFTPDFAILVSPVILMDESGHKSSRENLLGEYHSPQRAYLFSCDKRVTPQTPPTFLAHALDDRTVSCLNSLVYFKALKENNVKGSTLHIFPKGGHALNLRRNPGTANQWSDLVEKWLKEIGVIKP